VAPALAEADSNPVPAVHVSTQTQTHAYKQANTQVRGPAASGSGELFMRPLAK
jgi:hypothetical protein